MLPSPTDSELYEIKQDWRAEAHELSSHLDLFIFLWGNEPTAAGITHQRPKISQPAWKVVACQLPKKPTRASAGNEGHRNDNSCGHTYVLAKHNRYSSWTGLIRTLVWLPVMKGVQRFGSASTGAMTPKQLPPQTTTSSDCCSPWGSVHSYGTAMADGQCRWLEA